MSDDREVAGNVTSRRGAQTHRLIRGRRWRVSDPALDEELRQQLVNALMDARRGVKQALADDDETALATARSRVGDAKVALGERGPKWWEHMTDADIAVRVECGVRALKTVQEPALEPGDLRRRFRL